MIDVPRSVVFSDLDGTLLDHDTYDWTPARPALNALRQRGIPLVLCSSKTRVEMRRLAQAMDIDAPLIVENGGGVWLPASWPRPLPPSATPVDEGWLVVLGASAASLHPVLPVIARATDTALRGIPSMTVDEVAGRTGLSKENAALAMRRELSVPFVAETDVPLQALDEAARDHGLQVTRGGRFFHLIGPSDKGHAVRLVGDWLGLRPADMTLGFGDAPNDLSLLQAVGVPVIVPRRDGTPHPDLTTALPHATIAPAPGPAGWNAAALQWMADSDGTADTTATKDNDR